MNPSGRRRGTWGTVRLAGSGLLAVAALAGCGSLREAPVAPSPVPSFTGARLRCDLAPAATVGVELGLRLDPPTESVQPRATVCTYRQVSPPQVVDVRFQMGETALTFAAMRAALVHNHQRVDDLADGYDQAYTSSRTDGGVTTNTLAARNGSVAIVVTATAGVDQERRLMRRLFAAVPPPGSAAAPAGSAAVPS